MVVEGGSWLNNRLWILSLKVRMQLLLALSLSSFTSLNESFTLTKFTALLLAKVSYSTSTCLCSLGGMTKLDLLLLLDANS
jgi:hypothetical protein